MLKPVAYRTLRALLFPAIVTLVLAVVARAQSPALFGYPAVTAFRAAELQDMPQSYSFCRLPGGSLLVGGHGLHEFDGDRWSFTRDGLQSVYSLDFGEDGRVWAGAEGNVGWFLKEQDGTWQFHSFADKVNFHGQVWKVFGYNKGVVFATTNEVFECDSEGNVRRSWTFPAPAIVTVHRVNNRILIHSAAEGIYEVGDSGPKLKLIIRKDQLGSDASPVMWINATPEQWTIATASGLFSYHNGNCEAIAPETSRLLSEFRVMCATKLSDGRMAFGTYRGGIVVTSAKGHLIEQIDKRAGIPAFVDSLYADQDNLLWAATREGVYRLNLNPSTRVFDDRAGIDVNGTGYDCLGATNGRVAISSAAATYVLGQPRAFEPWSELGFTPHTISVTKDGFLLPGPRRLLLSSAAKTVELARTPSDYFAAIPSRIRPGEILASDSSSVKIVTTGGSPVELVHDLKSLVSSIAEDRSEDLVWLGTQTSGLLVADRFPRQGMSPRHPDARFMLPALPPAVTVTATQAGDVLVFTDTGAWIKPHGKASFTTINGYPNRALVSVSNVLSDGSLWVAFSETSDLAGAIGRIVTQPIPTFQPYSFIGLEAAGPLRGIFAQEEGKGTVLWIGGRSVVRHVVDYVPPVAPAAPTLAVFATDELRHRSTVQGPLPYSNTGLVFRFAQSDFSQRPLIRFQSRVSGIDGDWIPANKDSTRELTAIRDGTYKFQVRAVAETGLVSEPTVFTFTVLPPWWRTKLALWLEGIAAVGLIGGGIQWRVRTLRKRNLQLEQKVEARTAELKEANAAKTQFVANMSHDIRNPLSGIVGLTLALEDTPLDAQQREIVSTLRECTSYLSTLVDDVLDFASIEAGKIELHPAPYVPAEVLNSVVTALKAQCAEKRAFVTIETDPDIPRSLLGDAGRVQQILVNYLSNALKYGGGHIRVCASLAPDSVGEVEFAVADEGPGLTADDKTKLFTQFNRLDAARRSHVKGTGLGLAACRFLADAMGGSVGVDSEPGHGSRFFLRLPLVEATEPVQADDSLALPPTSVLLVEDTDYNALAAKAVLKKLGLTCDRAANGAEAIKLFAEKRHHIVLLDRNLPDMDGTEVAARIRELETDGLHAMIFAVTAYCTAEDKQKCLAAGMDAFVGKPLTPEKLRRTLLAAATQMLGAGTAGAPAALPTTPASLDPALLTLDASLLEYLAEGSPGGLALQVDRFIEALRDVHAELLRVQREGNRVATGDAVHRVLGHARMVNATDLTNDLIALENAARLGDFATVSAMLPAIARHIDRVTAALRRHPGVLRA